MQAGEPGGCGLPQIALHLAELRPRGQRPHVRLRQARTAEPQGADLGQQGLLDAGARGGGEDDAGGGRTHLAGIEENARSDDVRRRCRIAALKHHQRRLAAQLQRNGHGAFGSCGHDAGAGGIGAGEGNLAEHRIGAERPADGPAAGHDVQHTRRKAAGERDVAIDEFGEGGEFGRLEHGGAACGQRRGELPRGGDHREVPGHDQRHGPQRLQEAAPAERGIGQRQRLALSGIHLAGKACVIVEGGGGILHVDLRLEAGLAAVQHLKRHEVRLAGAQAFGEGGEIFRPLRAAGAPPVGEGEARRLCRRLCLRRGGGYEFGKDLCRGRADGGQRCPRRAAVPGAVEEDGAGAGEIGRCGTGERAAAHSGKPIL